MPGTLIDINAPALAKIALQLSMMIESDAQLRTIQTKQAPQAKFFDQRGFQGADIVGGTTAVTGAEIYSIQEAQAGNVDFYQLVVTFDAACGSGRYTIDGTQPKPNWGTPIPAGGVTLVIPGSQNIRNFKMIAETGQSLTFARNLFL